MAGSWSQAFYRQARSDYEMYLLLNREGAPACHRLHYLQMCTEKLAKSYQSDPRTNSRPVRSHHAFVRFMQLVKSRPEFRRRYGRSNDQFVAMIDSLLPLSRRIEELAPAGDQDAPNPEYPWEDGDTVRVPVEEAFANIDFTSPQMIKLLRFIDVCFELT